MSKTWQRQTGSAKRHGCRRNQAGYSPCSTDETLLAFSEIDSEDSIEKQTGNHFNALTTNLPVGDCTEVKVESSIPEIVRATTKMNGRMVHGSLNQNYV